MSDGYNRGVALNTADQSWRSLPPCGGGLGWGVAEPTESSRDPLPLPLPTRGREEARAKTNLSTSFGVILLAALFLAAPASAAPRSIADCEAIQAPHAFNACLASFGPMRGHRGASYPGVASGGGKSYGATHRAPRFGHGVSVSQGRGGRVRMEFTPGRR